MQVERTPLQGFLARSLIAKRKAEQALRAPQATEPEIEPVLSTEHASPTAPLADDVARLVRGRSRFPEILYGDVT